MNHRIALRLPAFLLAAIVTLFLALSPDLAFAAEGDFVESGGAPSNFWNPFAGQDDWSALQGASGFLADGRSTALMLYDYAMGDTCLTCDFLSYFMYALAQFSYAAYLYFYNFFIALAPVAMALWLGYSAAKLMVTGGEDGKAFVRGIVSRLALFAVLWIVAVGGSSTNATQYMWELTGPKYLSYAFGLSNEVRDASLNNLSGGIDGQIRCDNLAQDPIAQTFANSGSGWSPGGQSADFVAKAKSTTCFTERTHIMGLASGVAVILNTNSGGDGNVWTVTFWVEFLVTLVTQVIIGGFIIVVYVMSATWAIFLTLDVVTRGLITAAFSPLFMLLYLFHPTRNITIGAVKAMGGALVTAVTLSIIGVLSYTLITNTADLYNATAPSIAREYSNIDASSWERIAEGTPSEKMREFIMRIGYSNQTQGTIPMDFSAPWLWYIAFCGVAIGALGKKIMAMLRGLVGDHGQDAFANAATKSVRMGMGVAGTAAMAGAMIAAGPLAAGAMKGTAMAGGGLMGGAMGGVKGVGRGAMMGLDKAGAVLGRNVGHTLKMSNISGADGQGLGQGGGMKSQAGQAAVNGLNNLAKGAVNDGEEQ